jgi:hypothetical protein
MDTTSIVLVIVAVVAVLLIAGLVIWSVRKRRTQELQGRFGDEYDRVTRERGDTRAAESELRDREKRVDTYELRDLDPDTRQRYSMEWQRIQARFVDSPGLAVQQADELSTRVMRDRGYPVDDTGFADREADLSVGHAGIVGDYRAAHAISIANDHSQASTEDLREAMVHYRTVFEDVLGSGRDVRREVG